MVRDRKINVKGLFNNLQNEMLASLGVLDIYHAPTLGDYTELNWLSLFQDYLPKRYLAEKSFVVDSEGNISDAIDIVIFDALYSPFLLNKNGIKFVPAESVYAVFEIKQDISKKNIKYAGDKAASVRMLKRTSVPINNAGKISEPKKHSDIISGLLATRSSWVNRERTLINAKKALGSLKEAKKLDFTCCLEATTIFRTSKAYKHSSKSNCLIRFFYEFMHTLQSVGTVPALDIKEYLKDIN